MIKIFTKNKDGKIELTEDELRKLLDESYWEGFKANCHAYIYQTPNWSPYQWTVTAANNVAVESNNVASDSDYEVGPNERLLKYRKKCE